VARGLGKAAEWRILKILGMEAVELDPVENQDDPHNLVLGMKALDETAAGLLGGAEGEASLRRVAAAAGCVMQLLGGSVYFAGLQAEVDRGREYLQWRLVDYPRGASGAHRLLVDPPDPPVFALRARQTENASKMKVVRLSRLCLFLKLFTGCGGLAAFVIVTFRYARIIFHLALRLEWKGITPYVYA